MTNINVGLRLRPLLKSEIDSAKEIQWKLNENVIESTNQKHKLKFDNVFDENATNEQMYDVLARPIVSKAMEGFNGTIFAYGQTSSGKTYSMIGDETAPGIIPLAIKDIFKTINASADSVVRIGYIEIYNDRVYDLLCESKTELRVFEPQTNTLKNQKEFWPQSENGMLKYFHMGCKNRRVDETSHQSHTVFQVNILSRLKDDARRNSNLYFVDLAGSEKPDVTSSKFNEGLHINKSLLALGKIIRGVTRIASVVNEFKIIRILSPALSDQNLAAAIICTASPTDFEETFESACFAQNIRKVKKIGPAVNSETKLLQALRFGNARLKQEISRLSLNASSIISSPKRTHETVIVEGQSPKRIKLEMIENNESMMFTTLLNQIGDVEQEVEEKLMRINEQHHKAMQQKEKVIEGLRENLERTQNRVIEIREENENLKAENETIRHSKDKTINSLEEKLLETQNKLKDFLREVADLQNKISFLEISSASVSQMSAGNDTFICQKCSTPADENFETLKAQLEDAEMRLEEVKREYEEKLAAKDNEKELVEEKMKEKSRAARFQIIKKIAAIQNKFCLYENE